MATGDGALGAVLLTADGGWTLSAVVPANLREELRKTGKRQRNTQSELLAVLMLLLSCPEQLRGRNLILYEDNQAALENILAGSAADPDSRSLVAGIWLLAAVLRVNIWIEYAPSESKSADCFSRPGEEAKALEMRQLSSMHGLVATPPRLPSPLQSEPEAWAAAVAAAHNPQRWTTRAEHARTAARLGATDGPTIARLLGRVTWDARDGSVTLGWLQLPRRGIVAQATHYHEGLAQVLCMALKQAYPGRACTTIVMRQGELPQWPRGAAECIACLRARVLGPQVDCDWLNGYAAPRDVDSTDVVAGFFRIPIEGARALQDSAGLARRGFPLYAEQQA